MFALPHELSGCQEGAKNMTIFLHGWPDTLRLWDGVIQGVEKETLCLNITYPNYGDLEKSDWGVDFPLLVDRIKATIDQVDNNRNLKKMIVSHDWGCYFAYMLDKKYPGLINDIVALDVSPQMDYSLKTIAFTMAYQLYNALTFLIGRFFPQFLAKLLLILILTVFKYPYSKSKVNTQMNYPYFYLWKHILFTFAQKSKMHLYKYRPNCPVVYVYAQNKPIQFHTNQWLKQLEEIKNSEKHMVKGGHWIHVRHTTFLIELILRRINSILK